MENLGRTLIVFGGIAVVVGVLFLFSDRLPLRIGRLPLDFHFQRGNFSFYFPLGTSIVVSLLLTLVFGLLNRR